MLITAFILIGLGVLVKRFPILIAGYNTMSKEEKMNVDVKGLSAFMCYSLVGMGCSNASTIRRYPPADCDVSASSRSIAASGKMAASSCSIFSVPNPRGSRLPVPHDGHTAGTGIR